MKENLIKALKNYIAEQYIAKGTLHSPEILEEILDHNFKHTINFDQSLLIKYGSSNTAQNRVPVDLEAVLTKGADR